MADSQQTAPTAISLDELIALNDEIVALVRVGVPLDVGLRHLGGELPGRLGKLSQTLAASLQRGQTLPQVLEAHGDLFPPVYRAVVAAGIKAGRLSAALESVATTARHLGEARRLVVMALLYPLLLLLVAWGLFLFFVLKLAPVLRIAFERADTPAARGLDFFAGLGQTAHLWGPAVPAVVLLASCWWYFRSGRASLSQPRSAVRLLGWIPWVGAMTRSFRDATLAEILGLLVEHQVPLDEALVLAAEASGDRKLTRGAAKLAAAIRRGEPLGRGLLKSAGLPPLVGWLLHSGGHRRILRRALDHVAQIYRRRGSRQAALAQTLLPACATVLIGGGVTVAYGSLLVTPWISFLYLVAR